MQSYLSQLKVNLRPEIKMKRAPIWLRTPVLVRLYQSAGGVVLSNWLLQGTRYMLPVEVVLKIAIEASCGCMFFGVAAGYLRLRTVPAIVVSFLLAHTANWLIDGHFFTLLRFCRVKPLSRERFFAFPTEMKLRLEFRPSLCAVAIFGSVSRMRNGTSSDLDVRVITSDRFTDQILGALLVWRERFLAFLQGYPLDIYLATVSRGLERIRSDELPVVLFDRDDFFRNRYDKILYFSDVSVMSDHESGRSIPSCS